MRYKIIHRWGKIPNGPRYGYKRVIMCTLEEVISQYNGGNTKFQYGKHISWSWEKVNCAHCMKYNTRHIYSDKNPKTISDKV
jgi:hypothetical protein